MKNSKYAIAICALLFNQEANCIRFIEGGTDQFEDTISNWKVEDVVS